MRNLQLFLYISFFIAAFFMLTLLSNLFPGGKLVLLENNTPPLIMTHRSKYAKERKLVKLKMIFSFFFLFSLRVIETVSKQYLAFLAVEHIHSHSHAWNAIIDICETCFLSSPIFSTFLGLLTLTCALLNTWKITCFLQFRLCIKTHGQCYFGWMLFFQGFLSILT